MISSVCPNACAQIFKCSDWIIDLAGRYSAAHTVQRPDAPKVVSGFKRISEAAI